LQELYGNSKEATQKKKWNCLQEATWEIKLDTTNTLWSDLADRCFEEFKKKVENNTLPCSQGSVGK
jgi:hypothetical protein